MAVTPLKRKLAAILAADAVGYSRLMAGDEERTMRLLSAHRAVIDGIIEFHEGRIVNTAGDSVLAEFASPVQAVRCAVEIQDALRTRNDSLPEGQRLQFRIGVNLGDVMVKGDDLLGDGVNVAARLESVAEPGGICVSSSVYDQIAGKLDLGFVDIGAKLLKNIDRPVRIYRIDRNGRKRAATAHRAGRAARTNSVVAASLLVLAAVAVWHFDLLQILRPDTESDRLPETERAQIERQLAEARAAAVAAKERALVEAAAAAEAKRALEAQRAAEAQARAEAELAQARAEADAARREATARVAAAEEAAAAKRRLEEQRAAEARARAEAELARARAEAEEARRKAAAELAAAEEARRAGEASALAAASKPATVVSMATSTALLRDGRWSVALYCPPFNNFPERTVTAALSMEGEAFIVQHGERDAPLSISLRGVPNADGSLWLRGNAVTGSRAGARTIPARFVVKPAGERYEGPGRLGRRECNAVISRAP